MTRPAAAIAVVALWGSVVSAAPAVAAPAASSKKAVQPAVGPSADAPSAVLAAKKQGTRVEVAGDTTARSETFANPNGTFTTVTSQTPVRWQDKQGAWRSIDLAPVADGRGGFVPRSQTPGAARFADHGSPGATQVGTPAGQISWAPSGIGAVSAQVSGTGLSYPDALSGGRGVTEQSLADGGVEESVVLPGTSAPAAYTDVFTVPAGVTAKNTAAGVEFDAKRGGAVGMFADAFAYDASASDGGLGRRSPVTVRLVGQSGTSVTVRVSVSAAWLSSPGLKFPVTIDPSYAAAGTVAGWDQVQSAYPSTMEWDATPSNGFGIGWAGGGIDRMYYQLSLPSQLTGAVVLSATLSDEVTSTTTSASTTDTFDLYQTDAISSTTGWDNAPAASSLAATTSMTTTSTAPNTNMTFDVTSALQTEATAGAPTWTALLENANETTSANFVRVSNPVSLSITYDHAPGTPDGLSMSPTKNATDGLDYSSSATPSFSASAVDPDGDPVQLKFQVVQGSTVISSGTTASVASGATASWTSGTLADGAYTWEVRAYDGTEWGALSSYTPFTVDTAAPAAPSISCPGYPAHTWTARIAGGTSCTFSDTSGDIDGYLFDWTPEANDNWSPVSSSSATLDPPLDGLNTLYVRAENRSGLKSADTSYTFGVGTAALSSPTSGATTSTSLPLSATAPAGNTSVTFEYRRGTTGSFTPIPVAAVTNAGTALTAWPVATTTVTGGVTSPTLTWSLTKTLPDDGLVQIEAVFTDAGDDVVTTSPVSASLARVGTGADFATTPVGPVTVGLQSGNATLQASDVNVSSYGADLTVARTFNSLSPSTAGIFGPGWVSSIGSTQASSWSQVTDDSTYAVLTGGDGSTYTFTAGTATGSTVPFTADASGLSAGLTLTKNTVTDVFDVTDSSNSVTQFSYSSTGADYVPTTITSPGTTSSTGIVYNSSGRPLLTVAPDAASNQAPTTACPSPASASTWTAGCRGLQFAYNAASEVSEIDFVYVDNSGAFETVPVADYKYDATNRLTGEWDPRLSTPLVSSYAYDETSGDADYGRIIQIWPAQVAGSQALASYVLNYDYSVGTPDYGMLVSVTRTHHTAFGGQTATNTVDYDVPLTTAAGGPLDMDAAAAATWNQTDVPVSAVAFWPGGYVPSSTSAPTATDYEYATIDYFDASGRQVNTATYVNGAWAVETTQYDANGDVTSSLTAADRATALTSAYPADQAQALSTVDLYACDDFGTVGPCTGADQQYEVETDTYGPALSVNIDGTLETARDHTAYGYDTGAPNSDQDANGNPYMLQTTMTTSASIGSAIPSSSTADARTTQYLYTVGSDATGWSLGTALQTVTDPSGLDTASTTKYNEDSSLYNGDNLVVDQDQPSDSSGGTAGDTHTVYYTAGTNSQVAACGNKPAWANLVCETYPAAQPSDTSTIPTITYTYNDYLSVLTQTKAYGSTGTETITNTYDSDNRPTGQTIAVSGTGMGTAPSKTAEVYSASAGYPTDTEALNSSGGVTSDIATAYDDFGQPLSYTDANNQTTTYAYDLSGQSTSRSTPYDTDTITYSPGGQAVTETDSLAGTFTATYNADGALQTTSLPDGTVGTYAIDAAGAARQLTYTNSNWAAPITDSVTSNAQGDWASESVLNDAKAFGYDSADRLTDVQDTDAGSCTTRAYGYDADSNRTSLTTYAAASGGACQATTAASTETYAYDTADRLASSTTSGTTSTYAYDTQGDATTTPSVDAGGTGDLTATYFANGMLATQTQGTTTDTYTLDATLGRYASQADSTTGYTTVNDYSSTGATPAWSTTNGSWTSNVLGLDGLLDAEVTQSGTLILNLTDLHGDIIATVNPASDSAPSATFAYTEFGTAESGSGTPGTYGYLGADQIASSGLGGSLLMGARGYNTSLGRFDSTDPVFRGSANAYDYGAQNPITNLDLSGDAYCMSRWGCLTHSGSWRRGLFGWGMNFTQAVNAANDANEAGKIVEGIICGLLAMTSGIGGVVCGALVELVSYVVGNMIANKANLKRKFSSRWYVFDYGWHTVWGPIGYPYAGETTHTYY